MRKIIQKEVYAVWLLLLLFPIACATTPKQTLDINTLLQPNPNLPQIEQVEIIGTLAVQRLIAAMPKQTHIFLAIDTFTITSTMVTIFTKFPTEQVAADPVFSEIGLYCLAHQWGRTQILLDYIYRYDKLLTQRYEELRRQKKAIAWSNFFYGLSSMSYGMSNADATPGQRLSNELGLMRNQQAIQINQQLSEVYQQRSQNIEDLRLQIGQLKQQLISYSNFLKRYVDWVLNEVREESEKLSPEAVRILEAKVIF